MPIMRVISIGRLAPQTGRAIELEKGHFLRVIDTEGEQVADLVCFSRHDRRERLSSGRTFDYNNTLYLSKGHTLYSNRSNPMLTIAEDTVGKHDFLYAPCSPEMFERIYGHAGHHPSCLENLYTALVSYGIYWDDIPTAFNIFMNVDILPGGKLQINPPRSQAGDYILFKAEMDLIVGLTACSAELTNNYRFTPIDYEILIA
jgi:uncharacterized protein YcgI (DUF1989 family)